MRSIRDQLAGERGQVLVMTVLFVTVFLGLVALVVDVGYFYAQRRQVQNAADEAALAAAWELSYADSSADATAAALEYAAANGYTADGTNSSVTVNIPPTTGDHTDDASFVEVIIEEYDMPTFFLDLLTSESPVVRARGVAGLTGEEAGGPGPVPLPSTSCTGGAEVDGRVLASEDYSLIADFGGGGTDYGDGFFACDDTYYYFALRLNGPSTGGAVANENVYGDGAYHDLYQTGWDTGGVASHSFGKLKGSDRARFQVSCDGTPVHDFVQDYLRQNGADWVSGATGDGKAVEDGPAQSGSSLEWNLEHPYETGWGDDVGEDPLTQSPPFNPQYPSYDPGYSGWVWEMIYEFSVSRADYAGCTRVTFSLHNFGGDSGPMEGIHSSPAKTRDGVTLLFEGGTEVRLVE